MALPLPNLDDRRWADLVEEARALIPLYAPGWTDHNIHDPGITLIDLLAWVTEADLYSANRIKQSHVRKFLALVGVRPEPPQPSRAVVAFRYDQPTGGAPAAPTQPLPAAVEVDARVGEDSVLFRTLEALDASAAELRAVQLRDTNGFRDMTARWERGEALPLLGPSPAPDAALYLGFDADPSGGALSIYFQLTPRREGTTYRSGDEERRRLLEVQAVEESCPPRLLCAETGGPGDQLPTPDERGAGGGGSSPTELGGASDDLVHHSARVSWEYHGASGEWRALRPPSGSVSDETRTFTLDGRVRLHLTSGVRLGPASFGEVDASLYYVRCRVSDGAFDAPPTARLLPNAVRAVQAVPARSLWEVPHGTVDPANPPQFTAGSIYRLELAFRHPTPDLEPRFDARLALLSIASTGEGAPAGEGAPPYLRVLTYMPPTTTRSGSLEVETEWLGRATGEPNVRREVAHPPCIEHGFELHSLESGAWHEWRRRDDLFASGRGDRHYSFDPSVGTVTFGDGERGRVPPPGAEILAVYHAMRAEAGNIQPLAVTGLAASTHNRAIIADFDVVAGALEATNPWPSSGGAAAETVGGAAGRAFVLREARTRAITIEDYEALAIETPGTAIARAAAKPNVHPGFPCYSAPGVVTVVIVPHLPADRPVPSLGLIRLVQSYLDRRRLLGTRVIVTGPTYRSVSVRATVKPCRGADLQAIPARVSAALDRFFHPLQGGPDGSGWPIGRDVYRSEVLQMIDETPGVDHVTSLELVPEDGEPSCGNLCLGPCELVAMAEHRIEVDA